MNNWGVGDFYEFVIPAKAGIQLLTKSDADAPRWIPAYAGMTKEK